MMPSYDEILEQLHEHQERLDSIFRTTISLVPALYVLAIVRYVSIKR
jgi:hypothetical protein